MEDHADRQRGLDRDVRVRTLAAGLAAGRRACRWPEHARHRAPDPKAKWSRRHDAEGRPRTLANSVPDTETSRACTGFVSDTSSLTAPEARALRHFEATVGSHAPTPRRR